MPARFDARPAHVARQARALVDPHALPRVQPEVRPALPAVAVEADERPRVLDDLPQLLVVEVAHPRPGRGAREEERLDLEHVADPGDRALIEERGRDVA